MRILLVNDVAAPVGGAETMTLGLREELRRRGHDARMFASRALLDGADNPAEYGCFGTTSSLRTLNRTVNLDAYRQLRRVLAAFRPDVVHVRMFMTQLSPLILPLLRDLPSLYHAAWYETICPTGLKLLPDGSLCRQKAGRVCRRCLSPQAWTVLMLQRRLMERWFDAFDLFVANSEALRRRLSESGIEPTVSVWNGVPRRPPRPPLERPPVVAYAGRLSWEKGVEVLVHAFVGVTRHLPDARLLLVGDGPGRKGLERLVALHGLESRVTMSGQLPTPVMERALERAWVQVVPSLLEEPFGLAAAEAMMRGTAVVATNLGGLIEIVRHGDTGLLVPPNDPDALRSVLIDLLGDRDRSEAMGAAGRAWAYDRLSRERCVDRFVELYDWIGAAGR